MIYSVPENNNYKIFKKSIMLLSKALLTNCITSMIECCDTTLTNRSRNNFARPTNNLGGSNKIIYGKELSALTVIF